MPKIKIQSTNRTQQNNVITKCRNWGATARDGDYGPVEGKTAVVVNTKLGAGASILLSNIDFTPTKNPYTQVISYKEFMNLTECPWDASKSSSTAGCATRTITKEVPVPFAVPIEIPVSTGVCSQDTLQVTACDVLVQEAIAWTSLGLPFLQAEGVEVTMDKKTAYIINTKKNTAKVLTAKRAAKTAKKAILAGDNENPFAIYAREFDLVDNAVLSKNID